MFGASGCVEDPSPRLRLQLRVTTRRPCYLFFDIPTNLIKEFIHISKFRNVIHKPEYQSRIFNVLGVWHQLSGVNDDDGVALFLDPFQFHLFNRAIVAPFKLSGLCGRESVQLPWQQIALVQLFQYRGQPRTHHFGIELLGSIFEHGVVQPNFGSVFGKPY